MPATISVVSVPKFRELSVTTRLYYLDGLRGISAFYVVLYHTYNQVTGWEDKGGLSPVLLASLNWLNFGHLSVVVFIALSGYCLMLPVARSTKSDLQGALLKFFSRRAKRLLPPYYAAVGVSLLLIWCVPVLGPHTIAHWDIALPAFTPDVLLSHLFLVHNLSEAWSRKIEYPLWSVATEWQIYFVFALILLPVWRRWGVLAVIAAGFGLWAAIHVGFHSRLDGACFHFIGVFALGMAAAVLSFPRSAREAWWRDRMPWGLTAISLFLVCALGLARDPLWLPHHTSQVDTLAGLGTACLLVYCTRCLSRETLHRPFVLRLLESSLAVRLGSFSYSLYLIHAPVIALLYALLRSMQLSPSLTLALLMLPGIPIALGVSYLFFLAFERPFLNQKDRAALKAEKVGALFA